jgi:hypothetical protein
MMTKLAVGQKVRFNKRGVLSPTVPKNSKGYKYAVLIPLAGDEYEGDGVIEKGTEAVVVDYATHGTATADMPIVRVLGKNARVHAAHLDAM